MGFHKRRRFGPSETLVTDWMSWRSSSPAVLTVSTLVMPPGGEFECAIEERLDATTAGPVRTIRHSGLGQTSVEVEMPQAQYRVRLSCLGEAGIQCAVGIKAKAMP